MRNAHLVEEHSKRFRNVSFFKGNHEKLLDKPAGMYALDYTPPKYRVDNAFLRGAAKTVTPKPVQPVRIKDYDRTPDPEIVRMDDIRAKRMFDHVQLQNYKFSDASALIPSIVKPLREAKGKRPKILRAITKSYLSAEEKNESSRAQ